MTALDNLEAQLETQLARFDEASDCIQCGNGISSVRQRKLPGAVFCDECASADLEKEER